MSTYIDNPARCRWETGMSSWRADLAQRMNWLYGDYRARMTSPEAQADLRAWYRLGKPKP